MGLEWDGWMDLLLLAEWNDVVWMSGVRIRIAGN